MATLHISPVGSRQDVLCEESGKPSLLLPQRYFPPPKFRLFDSDDMATRIGQIIGALIATGVFCLGAYTLLLAIR